MKTKIRFERHEQLLLDMLTYSDTAEKLDIKEQREISVYVMNNLLALSHIILSPLSFKHKGFKINSAYRCERTNELVGGTRLSQHRLGQAADITCDNLENMWEDLMDMDIDQCIRYKNFIHVSYVKNRINRNQYIDKRLNK